MSTVSVVVKGKEICMASESLTVFGDTKLRGEYIFDPNKIFKWGDSLIGLVGYTAHFLVIESLIKNTKPPKFGSRLEIFEYFREIHKTLKDDYFLNPKEDEDDPYESSQMEILIANKTGIYTVHSLRDVYKYTKFWSFGSGRSFALGAMFSQYESDMSAKEIATAGVKAGIEFDNNSGGKIVTKIIKL